MAEELGDLGDCYVTQENGKRALAVSSGGVPLDVNQIGIIDSENSTTNPLTAGSIFPGVWVDTLKYGTVSIGIKASHASAIDGLSVEYSDDGVTKIQDDVFTLASNSGKTFTFSPANRYYRIVYTNGDDDQTSFNLQAILRKLPIKNSSHRISDSIIEDDDAELVKAILTAKANGGGFVNICATNSDNLRVTDAESGLAIAKGDVVNTAFIHKFGAAPKFDSGDGFVTVWDGANTDILNEMQYTYSESAIIDSISSSAGDTVGIEINGLDANYDVVTQTITLTGTTRKDLDTDLIRIFRMINIGPTDLAGTVYCFENTAAPGGVPTDSTKVRAVISIGNNQTLMALYTIPEGKTGYMREWYSSSAGARKTSVHVIRLEARPFEQVFQVKHVASIIAGGTSNIQHKYEEPEIFTEKTDIAMLANSDEDDASIGAGFDIVLVDNN